MFQSPDHYHNLSLRLSEVLSDIGVNERMVMRRRRAWLLWETMMNIHCQLDGLLDKTLYNFGSQTEASTTLDLKSDVDLLLISSRISVLQDWSEWKLGKLQLLMVQDETTSPGYCLLQAVRPDMPLPVQDYQDPHFTIDSRGRVLMRHSACFQGTVNGIRHGPARSVNGGPHQWDIDSVNALHCSSWPKEAEPWLQQQNVNGWPTADMKRYAVEHGCLVVPVAPRAGVNQNTEWRISTSQAERYLMFSLNMTQMRCYILMKMTIKTYLKPKCEDTISSFMCKTVLFNCIADTRASEWNDSNLLPCFNQCLQHLLHCILTENCPHFIIPGNNLLAGKLSFQTKQQVVEIMMTLTANIEQSLLGISIDQLGNRLHVKSGRMIQIHMPSSEWIAGAALAKQVDILLKALHKNLMQALKKNSSLNNVVVVYQNLTQNVNKLCYIYSAGSRLEQAACCLYAPPLCAMIGSIISSVNIHHSQPVPPAALQCFSAGLNSDFSSSRLKLASALYCAGQYERCEAILVHLNRKLEQTTVLSKCGCVSHITKWSLDFLRISQEQNEVTIIQKNIALCIMFLPCEINCVPEELRYEMFRSTQEDLPYRGEEDYWMDWAVADSIPFLYFLQYKVYSKLHRPAQQQQQAMINLARTINTEPNFGHRETALNLLGQCKEEENSYDEALCCYMMSLNVRQRNNAAKWHICRLLASSYNC